MITIYVPKKEVWDEKAQEFYYSKSATLRMEHSLLAISKWESKYEKPFLNDKEKTKEEMEFYYQCMCLDEDVDPLIFKCLGRKNIELIMEYIQSSQTATTIKETQNKRSGPGEFITNELIYYWMVANQIPFSCETWHLNRLLTLIRVCSIKNNPEKQKMSRADVLKQNAALNAARRKKLGSKG